MDTQVLLASPVRGGQPDQQHGKYWPLTFASSGELSKSKIAPALELREMVLGPELEFYDLNMEEMRTVPPSDACV